MILITGAAGYIGTELRRQLRVWGIPFIGVDNFVKPAVDQRRALEDGVVFGHTNDTQLMIDLMTIHKVTAVVNLAAVVGDPACRKYPTQARMSILYGVNSLISAIHEVNPRIKFIQASTCSVYGFNPDEQLLTEDSPVNPLSLYAELKVYAEQAIERSRLSHATLRFATAFGLSPGAMRYDLTVNEFTRDVFLGRRIRVYRENDWRPYTHVWDLARICMEAAWGTQLYGVYNVGDSQNNYTKKQIIEILKGWTAPDVEWVANKDDQDQRNYRVNFERLRLHRGAGMTVHLVPGISEMIDHLKTEDPDGIQADSQECRSDFLACPEG